MASWIEKLLSQGGHHILILHVLSCMATHTLVVLPVLSIVFTKINSIIYTFLWGENKGRAKKKWCMWYKVCKPGEEGMLVSTIYVK